MKIKSVHCRITCWIALCLTAAVGMSVYSAFSVRNAAIEAVIEIADNITAPARLAGAVMEQKQDAVEARPTISRTAAESGLQAAGSGERKSGTEKPVSLAFRIK